MPVVFRNIANEPQVIPAGTLVATLDALNKEDLVVHLGLRPGDKPRLLTPTESDALEMCYVMADGAPKPELPPMPAEVAEDDADIE